MCIFKKVAKILIVAALCISYGKAEGNNYVPIAPGVKSIEITLNNQTFTLSRVQDKKTK